MPIAQLISPQHWTEKGPARAGDPGLSFCPRRPGLRPAQLCRRAYRRRLFADLERDLSGPVIKGVTGRHPLPDPQTLIERLQAWGINADSEVVLYDDGPGAFAARAWWLLAWLGKRDGVFILDGGLKAWHAAGLPLSLDAPGNPPGTFTGTPDNALVLSAEQLQKRLGRPELTLLDARARRASGARWSRLIRWPGISPARNVRLQR